MKILMLTRYDRLGASSRMRTFQYLPHLKLTGWKITVSPLFSDRYLRQFYNGKRRWSETIIAYLKRTISLSHGRKYDLVWIEKELFPFLPALAERLIKASRIPYVVDYDDALFHRYDQHRLWPVRSFLCRKIDAVMKNAVLVVAGNSYLAQKAISVGAHRVKIIPTVVDLLRYSPYETTGNGNRPLIIGWIGTPWTSQYLYLLKSVFKSLKKDFSVRFVAVGAERENLREIPVEAWPWSEETEVDSLRRFDIGIMPVPDKPWMRYKCGYKLIQYMACSLPVVASPIGVNNHIVAHSVNGFLADGDDQWRGALVTLLKDADMRRRMGQSGREKVESWYSLQVQAPRLEKLLREVL